MLDETKYPSLPPYKRILNEYRDLQYKFQNNENSEDIFIFIFIIFFKI